jgi:integrase
VTDSSKQKRRTKVEGRDTANIYLSRSGSFEIAYRIDGKLTWFTCPAGWKLAEVKAKRAELTVARNEGTLVSVPASLTVAEAATEWLEECRPDWSANTYRNAEAAVRKYIVPVIGNVRVRDLNEDHVWKLVTKMDGLKTSTQALYLRMLSGLCGHLIDTKKLSSSPVTSFSRQRRAKRRMQDKSDKRVKVIENVDLLLAHTQEPYQLLVKTACLSGLRIGEVLGLRACDIGDGVIHVRGQLDRETRAWTPYTKTPESRREVTVSTELTDELRHSDAIGEALLFRNASGQGHWSQVVEHAFRKACDRAGLDSGLTFHCTRHTAASRWIAEGRPVAYVQHQLGHRSLVTTLNTYTHLWRREEEDARARAAGDAAYRELSRPKLHAVD